MFMAPRKFKIGEMIGTLTEMKVYDSLSTGSTSTLRATNSSTRTRLTVRTPRCKPIRSSVIVAQHRLGAALEAPSHSMSVVVSRHMRLKAIRHILHRPCG